MAIAAALALPWGIVASGPMLLDPVTLGLGAAVAVLSSVLPYTLELLALRRMPTSTPGVPAYTQVFASREAVDLGPCLDGHWAGLIAVEGSRSPAFPGDGTTGSVELLHEYQQVA
jgi:hypothetical protein